jgi:cob(I)alamin adenosyltransferase
MDIYTRTGDDGDTALLGGGRVPKSDRRVEAYGAVDELSSFIGLALTSARESEVVSGLRLIQNDLFALGASLAAPGGEGSRARPRTPDVPVERVGAMEQWIDEATAELPELREFVLPGGTEGAALLHVCRSVCRRAERAVVGLKMGSEPDDSGSIDSGSEDPAIMAREIVDPGIVPYLNRLSDLLFVWARLENHRAGHAEVPWKKE